jgi:DNA repair exonuclease SbcCD ATPase subunit
MMGTMGGDGTGEYPLGTGGPRVDPSDPNYVPPGTAGIKPLPPTKQPPMMPSPMPPMGGSDDLFGDLGAGSYDNLMSRAFQEYSGGASPYAGATDFLMNRSVFDRGVRPESSMPSTTMPSFGYSNQGGMEGLTQMQAQQPALQAQYDQFQQDIQSAQEAAQQRAQEQTDLASSERQALMDRIAALEGQEGPDLDAFGAQLRQDILGQMPEQIDTEALRREITGEVLAIAQQDFPDVTQIRDEVMRLLPEQEQVDVENLRRQIQESIDAGAPPEEIAALRQELQNRIRPVEEQLATIQDERPDIARQLGELRGEIGALPDIDVNELRAQIISQLPEQERLDIEALQRQIQDGLDSGMSPEQLGILREELQNRLRPVEEQIQSIQDERPDITRQIGELRGQLGALPDIDVEQLRQSIISQLPEQERVDIEALQRRIQESIDAGAPEEEIAGLRLELEQRLAPVEERVGSIRDQVAQFRESFDPAALREQIGNIRGRLEGLPNFDIDEIRRRVQEGIQPQTGPALDSAAINDALQRAMQERGGFVSPEVLERLRAVEQREGPDLGSIREQIGELRGQLSQRPEDRGVVPPDVLERLRAVEQREGPDLSGISSQIAALENRGLPPEVLERLRAVEQREGPDEAAIAERVRSGLDPRIADLQQRFSEVDTSSQAMADRIAAIREQQGQATEGRRGLSDSLAALREQQGQAAEVRRALEERLGGRLEEVRGQVSPLAESLAALREQQGQAAEGRRALEERLGSVGDFSQSMREQIAALRERGDRATQERSTLEERLGARLEDVRGQVSPLTERIAQLRGRLDERPAVDMDAIARRVREGIDIPQVDLGGIREQIANLRGRLDERPTVDMDAIARRVREGIDIPQVDLSGVQNQIAALENRGLPPEILERLRAVEQRKGPDLSNITEQIGRLRGRLDERPQIDENALIERIRGGIQVPQVDLSGIREQIANLRGRIDERPAGTGGVKPLPTPPKKPTFPPGYRGPRGGG